MQKTKNTKLHDGMIKSRSTKIGDWIIVGI